MKYCKICLNIDTRPGTKFSENGLCPVCQYDLNPQLKNNSSKSKILEEIKKFGIKNKSPEGYDCIIGVSGGKDSTRQAIYVRDILKMNPLLVCLSYPPEMVTKLGVENISNLIELGFDTISVYPDPLLWKKFVKEGFIKYGNYLRACELALFSSVPRFAIAYQIPLIWWGENSAIQVGESDIMGENEYDGNNLKKMNTLQGGDTSWLLKIQNIKKNQLFQFSFPTEIELKKSKTRIIFLGYFMKNWSTLDNGIFSILNGLKIRKNRPWETGDLNGITALDEDWVTFNQGIKYLKFGFGRISDDVNEDIRLGRISRDEGIKLVEKFDGNFSEDYVNSFCNYIKITKKEFWYTVEKFINYDLFEKKSEGNYIRKFKVGVGI